ncbi:hypothetical protein ASD19_12405 [Microbacterium sp. Root53]|uniref:recombinase family protein n=1 Tax=Microbacterium sp. Root53 TaxID=1736553 RepID=UPI0006FC98C5|nr:recombinase family protein [Microbacterium sp. Root53]KQZ07249.1 hypothetical protein ASD19_12405 [Microbacterium sp. Root53]
MPPTAPRRAAVYLRISLDASGDGLAVERQREDALALIEARGWHLVGEYVDNSVSASKRDVVRPAYSRMVADYERGLFDAIVCYDLDRLTRQPRQLEDWIDAAERGALVIVTANGDADLGTDAGRLFARVKAAVARSEIERKGARQRRANEQRIAQGRPLPTRRRYGYEADGVTVREDEAAVVRDIFERVARGDHLRAIVRDLLDRRVDPATGRTWSTGRLRQMLRNPAYAGELRAHGVTHDSDAIEPIVSRELAAEVRAILADTSRRTDTRGPGRRYLASGLVACGGPECERALTSRGAYYVCRSTAEEDKPRDADGRLIRREGHVGIARDLLDRHLREEMALALLTTRPEVLAGEAAPMAPLVARLDRIEAATLAIITDRDEGLVTPAAARARLVTLREEREAVEAAPRPSSGSPTGSTSS